MDTQNEKNRTVNDGIAKMKKFNLAYNLCLDNPVTKVIIKSNDIVLDKKMVECLLDIEHLKYDPSFINKFNIDFIIKNLRAQAYATGRLNYACDIAEISKLNPDAKKHIEARNVIEVLKKKDRSNDVMEAIIDYLEQGFCDNYYNALVKNKREFEAMQIQAKLNSKSPYKRLSVLDIYNPMIKKMLKEIGIDKRLAAVLAHDTLKSPNAIIFPSYFSKHKLQIIDLLDDISIRSGHLSLIEMIYQYHDNTLSFETIDECLSVKVTAKTAHFDDEITIMIAGFLSGWLEAQLKNQISSYQRFIDKEIVKFDE